MKNHATVVIDVNGAGLGTVHVDGEPINPVQAVSVAIEAGEAPVVSLRLAVRDGTQLRCEGAALVIDNVVMPESIELALLRHLTAKHDREIDVTTLQSTARERSLRYP